MESGDEQTRQRHGLSHNLTREWVTDRLSQVEWLKATIQSEWVGEGIAFPQTSGEHNDPTGVEPPDLVNVYVTVPASVSEASRAELVSYLQSGAEADPHFEGRFRAGHMEGLTDVEEVESLDQGAGAQRLTLRFSVRGPVGPAV